MKKISLKRSEVIRKYTGILLLIMFLGISSLQPVISEAAELGMKKADALEEDVLVESGEDFQRMLLNKVDGYSIILPLKMDLVDSNSTDIRVVLEDEHRRLEIYKQPILAGSKPSAAVYIGYSNGFLNNIDDHKKEYHQKLTINGRRVEINQWSREKLVKLDNDKNYYVCIDIIDKNYVYTFFVKSDKPFYQVGGYMDVIEGFSTFEASALPKTMKFKEIENNSWNEETREFYQKYFSDESDLSWGIFEYSAPKNFNILKALENRLDYNFEFLLSYKHIHKDYPVNYVKNTLDSAYKEGRIVELTLQTTSQAAGEGNMVYDILNGQYDEFLNSFVKETVEFGHPVLFRFANEMNGDWCDYSAYHTSRDPEIYKEMYKYIYKIFEEAQADNVVWVWNPNEKSFPDFKWNDEMMYYPGDEYVDIVGLTGYNNGNYYRGEIWRSFIEIYEPLYLKMASISEKPLMITEFSSSSIGGNKEQWVRNMFNHIDRYDRIKVAIWWNGRDLDSNGNIARPYFINDTEELIQVFRENFKRRGK